MFLNVTNHVSDQQQKFQAIPGCGYVFIEFFVKLMISHENQEILKIFLEKVFGFA